MIESGDIGVFSETSPNQGHVKDWTILNKERKIDTSTQRNMKFQKNCELNKLLHV